MAKRGGTNHLKRLATPKAVPIKDKKARTWILNTAPGPHAKKHSLSLGVLLRDVLKVVASSKEAKKILTERKVSIDGRVRADVKFPVGLMDLVTLSNGKTYRIVLDSKGRLMPLELEKNPENKIARVVGKQTIPGGKLTLSLHDGKTLSSDNHVKVGDSVVVSLPVAKLKSHLKLEKGARCLIREGKHAGSIVKLMEIIPRKAGKPSEAVVSNKEDGEFITVAKYLFVVDDSFSTQ